MKGKNLSNSLSWQVIPMHQYVPQTLEKPKRWLWEFVYEPSIICRLNNVFHTHELIIFHTFIDTLKFNLSECVEFLFLTSIDTTSKTTNMEIFKNLLPYTTACRLL